jgi:hypothetical protein
MTNRVVNVFARHTGLDPASSDLPPLIPPLVRGDTEGWIPAQHTAGMTGGKTEFITGLRLPLIAYCFPGVS